MLKIQFSCVFDASSIKDRSHIEDNRKKPITKRLFYRAYTRVFKLDFGCEIMRLF